MSTYELCKGIRNAVLIRTAEVFHYNWSAEISQEYLKELPDEVFKYEGFEKIDPSSLTEEQMYELGFRSWSEDNPMMLIPLWLLPFLIDEIEAMSIDDEEVRTIKVKDMDTDHRFGSCAYGVIPTPVESE